MNLRYEERRRAIAQREWNKLRTNNPVTYNRYNTYEQWYRDSFLVDAMWLGLIVSELGSEEEYDGNNAISSGDTGTGDHSVVDTGSDTDSDTDGSGDGFTGYDSSDSGSDSGYSDTDSSSDSGSSD